MKVRPKILLTLRCTQFPVNSTNSPAVICLRVHLWNFPVIWLEFPQLQMVPQVQWFNWRFFNLTMAIAIKKKSFWLTTASFYFEKHLHLLLIGVGNPATIKLQRRNDAWAPLFTHTLVPYIDKLSLQADPIKMSPNETLLESFFIVCVIKGVHIAHFIVRIVLKWNWFVGAIKVGVHWARPRLASLYPEAYYFHVAT